MKADKNNVKDFFNKLSDTHCITPVWEKMLYMLMDLEPNASFEALAVFCIYFSLLDDGNICIPVSQEMLIDKWTKKWEGLLLQEGKLDQKEEDYKYFSEIISKGLPDVSKEKLPNLIDYFDKENYSPDNLPVFSKPFVIDSGWLFASKYFKAKINIENRINTIMTRKNTDQLEEEKKKSVREYFEKLTSAEGSKPMILEDEQIEALLRGLEDNLIITGGPGTGKTTVVCYLLWRLFLDKDFMDYSLFLAAPSGKAADRLTESISESLANLNLEAIPQGQEHEKACAIFEKLNSAQASTIHRLLSFNSQTNGFRYNEKNRFNEKSIFVIDEASMIDITLFSSLLEAIPDGAKVFILGDKDQLPSVQAGAVLGELLAKKSDSVAELKKSKRFNSESPVGLLKSALREDVPLNEELLNLQDWKNWEAKIQLPPEDPKPPAKPLSPKEKYPVYTFKPPKDYSEKKEQLEEIISEWTKTFYAHLVIDAKNIWIDSSEEQLESIWDKASMARILCAERQGILGVEEINKQICEKILKTSPVPVSISDNYYAGQLLMLTKNQSMFCLYNGDSGIVIEHDGLNYLMVKKSLKTDSDNSNIIQQGIVQKGSYIFYPLHLLPKESIETAYAITIHKSQGSGYKAIFVLLPEQEGHPLLNRQIAYTAITRTKGSTYIFADYETLENARKTIIQRDTLISLN